MSSEELRKIMACDDGAGEKPVLVVSGASGFVGSHFINAAKDGCVVWALARRRQRDSEVPVHPNVRWLRVDLGDGKSVQRAVARIAAEGPVDFVFHFAGYYDFSQKPSPEYQRTNVDGTRHLLEGCGALRPRRFVFASSLAACDFSDPRRVIDENTPADGDHPYAVSKRLAEELVAGHAGRLPVAIVRLAAIYSDWCEYAPLYVLLDTWLKGGLRSRCIAGRGTTAIPYLHVDDLSRLWFQVMRRHAHLEPCARLVASPSGCVSHEELFRAATRCVYGRPGRPIHVPRWLAWAGIAAMGAVGRIIGRPPFEQPWMVRYVDRRMVVDASRSQARLQWRPLSRLRIDRRLLFLVERMRSNPLAWERRNQVMTKRQVVARPGLKIYNGMQEVRDQVIEQHLAHLTDPANADTFPHYQSLDREELERRAHLLYAMLEAALQSGDRLHLLGYAGYLARTRLSEGFCVFELTSALKHQAGLVQERLLALPDLAGLEDRIRFEIGITSQLLVDEIESIYEERLTAGQGPVC